MFYLPSKMTIDFGVASRSILQLHLMVSQNQWRHVMEHSPFVQLDLEGAGVGEHVVVRTHTGQDRVNWAQPKRRQRNVQ